MMDKYKTQKFETVISYCWVFAPEKGTQNL